MIGIRKIGKWIGLLWVTLVAIAGTNLIANGRLSVNRASMVVLFPRRASLPPGRSGLGSGPSARDEGGDEQQKMISASAARAAEHEARKQRLDLARLLRADETKVVSPSAMMHLRRVMAAARDRSSAYDALLAEAETQRLFHSGALYFAKHGA